MDLFVQNMDAIRRVANKVARKSGYRFEVDELINAAYIAFDVAITNNPALIEKHFSRKLSTFLFRVGSDMKDYVRTQTRLKTRQRREEKGTHFPEMITTSFQVKKRDDYSSEQSIYEPIEADCHITDAARKDYIANLCWNSSLTDEDWKIIQGYFYEEKSLKQVGKEIGKSEAATCKRKQKVLKKLLTCAKQLV